MTALPVHFVNEHTNMLAMYPDYKAYADASLELSGVEALALAKRARASVEYDAWLDGLNREAFEAYYANLPYTTAEQSVLVMRNAEVGFVDVYLMTDDSVHAVYFPYVYFTSVTEAVQSLAVMLAMFSTSEYGHVDFQGETLPYLVLDKRMNVLNLFAYEALGQVSSEMTDGQVREAGRALSGKAPRPEMGPSLHLVQMFEDREDF